MFFVASTSICSAPKVAAQEVVRGIRIITQVIPTAVARVVPPVVSRIVYRVVSPIISPVGAPVGAPFGASVISRVIPLVVSPIANAAHMVTSTKWTPVEAAVLMGELKECKEEDFWDKLGSLSQKHTLLASRLNAKGVKKTPGQLREKVRGFQEWYTNRKREMQMTGSKGWKLEQLGTFNELHEVFGNEAKSNPPSTVSCGGCPIGVKEKPLITLGDVLSVDGEEAEEDEKVLTKKISRRKQEDRALVEETTEKVLTKKISRGKQEDQALVEETTEKVLTKKISR
jgi:hypothetical protein